MYFEAYHWLHNWLHNCCERLPYKIDLPIEVIGREAITLTISYLGQEDLSFPNQSQPLQCHYIFTSKDVLLACLSYV